MMTRYLRSVILRAFILELILFVIGVIILKELLPAQHRRSHMQGWKGQVPPPLQTPIDAVWQPVAGTKFRFYVYSAYLEQRTSSPSIRIIAATKTCSPESVVCLLWLPGNRTVTLEASVKVIREHWNLEYSASYVLCHLSDSGLDPQETIGAAVSVMSAISLDKSPTNILTILDTKSKNAIKVIREHWNLEYSASYVLCHLSDSGLDPQETIGAAVSVMSAISLDKSPTNVLTILDTKPKNAIKDTIHLCVKPFHSYSRTDWLVEWFEMNQFLGASHFYMYNHSMSPAVDCVIDFYRTQGVVTLLPWKLPFVSKVEIRTEGQFAAFNDCLYRSMSLAGWLLVIDVDELVIPRKERALSALLASLRRQYKPPARPPSSFLFRNAFFYLSWEDDPIANVSLITARKTRRRATPHAWELRSKYTVRPSEAVELGNHFVWELVPGAFSVGVPPARALLHHYRVECEYSSMNCLTVPSTIDRAAHAFTEELSERVYHKKKEILKVCPAAG